MLFKSHPHFSKNITVICNLLCPISNKISIGTFSELPNLAVAERPCLWGQSLYRSTPLLKNLRVCAVLPSSLVSAGSPRDRTLNSGRLAQPCF